MSNSIKGWEHNKKVTSGSIIPLYSIPHLSFTMTGFPVKLFKKGLGLTGTVYKTKGFNMQVMSKKSVSNWSTIKSIKLIRQCD